MRFVATIRIFAALYLAFPGAPHDVLAQGDVATGGWVVWQWPVYGPYAPYPYGGFAPWASCMHWPCVDGGQLRRDFRREMRAQELRRTLDLRADREAPRELQYFGMPRYLPPPTPESQVQPRYRGSGDVRPEYQHANQAR